MKAIIYEKYGTPDVLQLKEIEKPTPKDNEVLVEVYASSVNYANPALVRGIPFMLRLMGYGLLKPNIRIPGGDIAGIVKEVGRNVKLFKPGDEVYGDLADLGFRAFAEFVCAPENAIALKPVNITFEEAAAAAQSSIVALQGLRNEGHIQPGQKILIFGASGGIGTFAVQIAKSFGAEVTGVCSTKNLELILSIGADHALDYTQEDFAHSNQRYDLILATIGYRSIFDYQRLLKPKGIYVATGGALSQIFQPMLLGPLISITGSKRLCSLSHRYNQQDLFFMRDLFESKKVKSIIDRRYPLSETAEAFRYYEKGHTRGKIVITIK